MTVSRRRIRAVFRKELREYRRNGAIVVAMGIYPLVFIIQPLIAVLVVSSKASRALAHENPLLYLLAIPAIVPATLASYSVVGERQQGTLEPVLTTPVRREEFLLGKALAAFIPSLAISYVVYGIFVALVELFAHPGVASSIIRGSELVAQLVFTPLLAAWSIWVGIGISARTKDVRTGQQLAALASLPTVAVTSLIAYKVIDATFRVAAGLAIALLILDRVGWRVTSAAFDRERLITGSN
jgi:ABC-type Na+ efflux pump permease subunit